MNRGKRTTGRSRNTQRPPAQTPAQSDSPVLAGQGTTPYSTRKNEIRATGQNEKEAHKTYLAALAEVNNCDPLSVGYDACQAKLQKATNALLRARELHRLALAGYTPVTED